MNRPSRMYARIPALLEQGTTTTVNSIGRTRATGGGESDGSTMKNTITYAIGDVHGCFDKLMALLAHCDAHSGSRKPRFVFLGDYVDRGPDSKRVVEFLMRGQSNFPERFICLKGNHEELLVSAARPNALQEERDAWICDGGAGCSRHPSLPCSKSADFPLASRSRAGATAS